MKRKWLIMAVICFCFAVFVAFFQKTVKIVFITDLTMG